MMSRKELLKKQYQKNVDNVRKCAKDLGFTEKNVDDMFEDCFNDLKNEIQSSNFYNRKKHNAKAQKYFYTSFLIKIFILFTLFAIFTYILLNVHQATSSIVLRNVQSLIYPGFKIVRFLSVPVLKIFPSLIDLYDESCLMENPYFYVSDMECWPCTHVHSVMDLTGITDTNSFQSGAPFIIKTTQNEVNFTHLQETYKNNKEILDREVKGIKSTNSSLKNLERLFNVGLKSDNTHVALRINKMVPAQIFRKLFPKPNFLSDWSGQSVERFIMIDEPHAEPYALPNMECSYIFVLQGSGERTIILKPSKECSSDCRTVSVVLKPSYALWYNWWYWRPISLPTENATGDASISYINSYC